MCQTGTYVSVDEAARLLGTTGMRVLMMLKKNELTGRPDGESWLVDKASLHLCGTPKPADIVRKGGCGGGCGSGCSGE